MMIPYTPSELIAKTYRIPTLRSDTTQPGANGITAQTMKAVMTVITGAIRKTVLSAPAGTMISFNTNLIMSAKDCRRPNGPTTLGPLRIWTLAQILRSASRRKATATSTPTVISRTAPVVARVQPPGVVQKLSVIGYSAASRTGAMRRALSSAMVALARAIGLFRYGSVTAGTNATSPSSPLRPSAATSNDSAGAR